MVLGFLAFGTEVFFNYRFIEGLDADSMTHQQSEELNDRVTGFFAHFPVYCGLQFFGLAIMSVAVFMGWWVRRQQDREMGANQPVSQLTN